MDDSADTVLHETTEEMTEVTDDATQETFTIFNLLNITVMEFIPKFTIFVDKMTFTNIERLEDNTNTILIHLDPELLVGTIVDAYAINDGVGIIDLAEEGL